jgi:hypothetical protein
VIASLHSQYVALASKLRAVPGLRLITPESAGSGGAVINYQVDFKVEVMDDDRQLVNISARTLSRPSGNDAGVQPGPDGVQAARSGAIQSFAQWGTQGFNGQRPAPERDLDRFIDAARVSIFPTSPSFQQDLLARLRDSRVDSSERWVALNNLLQSGGLVGAPLDPAIISAGIDYASSEVDPELRASIWEQLANSGAPAIVTPLVRALVAERDEKSRIHLMQVLARNHGADPQARAALESIARVEDHQLTRMIAQHLLAGGTAWNEYLLSTLKNEQLPDAQRIEPLSYAGFSPQSLLGEPVLDEQAIRMLGGILSRMKSGSDGARIANLLGRIRSQVALDVIIDIVRPAEGHPQALREIRSMVLAQLGDLIRARYDARARTFAEEVAAHDDDPEIRDVARKMLESVSR